MSTFAFGPYTFREESGILPCEMRPLNLRPVTASLLGYLITQRDRVVPKEELLEELWPDIHVSENTLMQSIKVPRRAFGDSTRDPCFIKTFPKRGYRWICEGVVQVETGAAAVSRQALPVASTEKPRRMMVVVALSLLMSAVIFWWGFKPEAEQGRGELSADLTLAVLPFINETGDPDFQWLEQGISDMVASRLDSVPGLTCPSMTAVHGALALFGDRARRLGPADKNSLRTRLAADVVLSAVVARAGERMVYRYQLDTVAGNKRGELFVGDLPGSVIFSTEKNKNIPARSSICRLPTSWWYRPTWNNFGFGWCWHWLIVIWTWVIGKPHKPCYAPLKR